MARARSYAAYICDLGYYEGMPMVAPPPTTPDCEPHTPRPKFFIAGAEWAEMMMKTHVERQCKGCGLWLIWKPKRATR